MVKVPCLCVCGLVFGCGGKTSTDGGADGAYDGPYMCVYDPSPVDHECTQALDLTNATFFCDQADAGVAVGSCPTGYLGCCFFSTVTNCFYPPTYIDAAAATCADFDGSFVRY